jgi:cobalt-zinc-cadmium efflux system membrane fusion protein
MPPPSRNLLVTAAGYLPTLLVLVLLATIGWWGAIHEWKLGSAREEDNKPEKTEEKEARDPLRPIELGSEEVATEAGIRTEPAKQQSVPEYIITTGEVDYDQNRLGHLGSRVSGTVWSVEKQEGDVVARGDVLALISSAEVGRVKGEVLNAMVQYQLKSKLYQGVQAASNSVPERQIREAEAQMREARIRLFSEQQALLNLGLEIRLEDALKSTDEQLVSRLRVLGLPSSVLERVNCETLTNNLVPITSPFDGIVVKRDLVVGEQVNTIAMHFTVADLRRVWIMLNVRLEDIPRIRLGQEIAFETEGFKQEVPSGKLVWISAEVDDKTHTLAARAEVPNHLGRLRPHSFGTGRILVAQRSVVTVPNEAVQSDVGPNGVSQLVFVSLSNSTFQPRRVEVGLRGDKFTEIKSGIQAGEPAVVGGSHRLKSEMQKDRISGVD